MNEEILRIQRMVAEGKVSAEESVELLESVGGPPPGNLGGADASEVAKRHRRELFYHRLALALALLGVFICFKLYAETRRERDDLRRELEGATVQRAGGSGWSLLGGSGLTGIWRSCPTAFPDAQAAWRLDLLTFAWSK